MEKETFLELIKNKTPKQINNLIESKGKRKLVPLLRKVEKKED